MKKYSVILCGTQNSGNLGAVARLCYNFQVEGLLTVNQQCEIDIEAKRRAVDAVHYLNNILQVKTIDEIKSQFDLLIAFTGVPAGEHSIERRPLSLFSISDLLENKLGNIGLVFGPENVGLSNHDLLNCDIVVTIPMLGVVKSSRILNLSHAVCIALFELNRNSLISEGNRREKEQYHIISRDHLNYLLNYYKQILEFSWIPDKELENSLTVFNNLISRTMMTDKEAGSLVWIFRAIYKGFVDGKHPDRKDD
jgi:tRNA/rRNA methyltransferase